MVELHFHVVLVALQNLFSELRLRHRRSLVAAISKCVALLVGLGCDIETILVAQVIPAWVVGIVACAHGVDVEALHDLDVLNHAFHCYHVAAIWIYLVSVGTLYEHRLTVYEQLGVLDFHLAESHLLRNDLHDVAAAVFHYRLKREQIRSLRCPLLHVAHHEAHCGLFASAEVGALLCHDVAVGIEQAELHDRLAFYPCVYEQFAVLVVVFKVGCDADVFHLHFVVLREKVALASHARQTPEVLVFAHGAVAPAEALKGDEVLARMEIFSDVKLGCNL